MQDKLWTCLKVKKPHGIVCYAVLVVYVHISFFYSVAVWVALPGSVVHSCLMGIQTHARHPACRIHPPSPRNQGYGSVLWESVRRRKRIVHVLRWLTGVDKAKEGGWTTEIHFPAIPVIYSPSGAELSPAPTDQPRAVRTSPVHPHPPIHPLPRATFYPKAIDFLRSELKDTQPPSLPLLASTVRVHSSAPVLLQSLLRAEYYTPSWRKSHAVCIVAQFTFFPFFFSVVDEIRSLTM